MPHDCKGRQLQVGDEVTFRARVQSLGPGETACNGTFETVRPAGVAQSEYTPVISCNTALCEKAESAAPAPAVEEAPAAVPATDSQPATETAPADGAGSGG